MKIRKARFAFLLIVLVLAFFYICGCSPAKDSVVKQTVERSNNYPGGQPKLITTIDLSPAKTMGSFSYIPINMDSTPRFMANLILEILQKFEEANPQLEIIENPKIDRESPSFGSSTYRYHGIWIHHRPRQK